MKITKQQGPNWVDESGTSVPANRLTGSEKLREREAVKMANKAFALNSELEAFKIYVRGMCAEVVKCIRNENNVTAVTKGNFTWYNFDHTVKIEVDVSEAIKFSETEIDMAREKLEEIVTDQLEGDDFVKSLVTSAFTKADNNLDPKKIMDLRRHTQHIKVATTKKMWLEAMELIDKSVRRPSSKNYFKIWVRNEHGKYQGIDLNFSSIDA